MMLKGINNERCLKSRLTEIEKLLREQYLSDNGSLKK
jgi:hypothetical protein